MTFSSCFSLFLLLFLLLVSSCYYFFTVSSLSNYFSSRDISLTVFDFLFLHQHSWNAYWLAFHNKSHKMTLQLLRGETNWKMIEKSYKWLRTASLRALCVKRPIKLPLHITITVSSSPGQVALTVRLNQTATANKGKFGKVDALGCMFCSLLACWLVFPLIIWT